MLLSQGVLVPVLVLVAGFGQGLVRVIARTGMQRVTCTSSDETDTSNQDGHELESEHDHQHKLAWLTECIGG